MVKTSLNTSLSKRKCIKTIGSGKVRLSDSSMVRTSLNTSFSNRKCIKKKGSGKDRLSDSSMVRTSLSTSLSNSKCIQTKGSGKDRLSNSSMVRTSLNTSLSKRKCIKTKGSGEDRLRDYPMVRTSLNTSLHKRKFIKTKVSGKDWLSDLPEYLLCQILSKLPTKDSVRTSVLSPRWRNLWSHVSALDLGFHDFKDDLDKEEFIDSFMKSHKELDFKLKSFKLVYDVNEHFHDEFVWRLNKVVKRGVCELTVLNMVDVDEALVRMPLSLYSCATLVSLTLYCVVFDHLESKSVSLPCVKSMYLEGVKFDGDSVLETLISSCPVLEDLTVITHPDDYLEVVRVRSQSLKSFRLESQLLECDDPDVGFECDDDPDVEIDAPYLEYMSIRDYQLRSFIIHNIGPSAEVNIDVVFDFEYDDPVEITKIHNFLIAISTFHKVTISARTLEVIHSYSEVEPLPPFSNLSRLDASLVESSWKVLPAFLGCCMNLHSLVVELGHLPEIEEIKLSPVPQCVLSSINSLQLKTPSTPSKMKLATYFWKNCTALKKMHLSGR